MESATLYYAKRDGVIPAVTMSTIQAPWGEGTSPSFEVSEGGSTYNNARHPDTPWAWPGSHFPDVVYGNGHSLMHQADSVVEMRDGNEYYGWTVEPALVQANAVGAAHGLAVFETERLRGINPRVSSREQGGQAPYLEVVLGAAAPAPAAIADLATVTAGAERGELGVSFTVPENAFTYDVTVNGTAAPRYLVPYAGEAGSQQTIWIRDMGAAGDAMTVAVTPVSASGARGPEATVDGTAVNFAPMPLAGHTDAPAPVGADAPTAGDLRVWAFPETDLLDAQGGFVDGMGPEYRTANPRFSGGRLTLSAAGRETVAFLVALESDGDAVEGITVAVSALPGVAARVNAVRSANVDGQIVPEVIMAHNDAPGNESLGDVSTAGDVGNPGSGRQLVLVELAVPAAAEAANHTGALTVSHAGGEVVLPIDLEILPFALPARPHFTMDMNTYGLPDTTVTLWAFQKVARWFRTYVDVVPYSHCGRSRFDMRRPEGGGRHDEDAYTDTAADT